MVRVHTNTVTKTEQRQNDSEQCQHQQKQRELGPWPGMMKTTSQHFIKATMKMTPARQVFVITKWVQIFSPCPQSRLDSSNLSPLDGRCNETLSLFFALIWPATGGKWWKSARRSPAMTDRSQQRRVSVGWRWVANASPTEGDYNGSRLRTATVELKGRQTAEERRKVTDSKGGKSPAADSRAAGRKTGRSDEGDEF